MPSAGAPREYSSGSPRRRRSRAAGARALRLLLALGLLAACREPASAPSIPPDAVLVVVDTLRADRCSPYGYPRATTPTLLRLAGEGVLFETAYAPVSATCPSHATLFTSTHPLAHGVVRNGFVLADEERTLAEVLQAQGYRTAGFVSSFPVSARFGFDQGFDHYDDRFERRSSTVVLRSWQGRSFEDGFDRRAGATTDAVLAWLEAAAADPAPLFLFVHYFDPHAPYKPPAPYLEALGPHPDPGAPEQLSRYDAEVAYTDAEIGRLLERVRALRGERDPLVVVTADHGEGLLARGWMGHNRSTYDEEVRVPLVLWWPGHLPAGVRSRQPAHLIDVAPTLLAALGLDAEEGAFEGIDLLPFARGSAEPDLARPLFLQRPFYAQERKGLPDRGLGFGLRMGRWKYFEAREEGVVRLFDVLADPGELDNLAPRRPDVAARLAARVEAWRQEQSALHPPRPLELPSDVEQGLRALGYLDDDPNAHGAPDDDADPNH